MRLIIVEITKQLDCFYLLISSETGGLSKTCRDLENVIGRRCEYEFVGKITIPNYLARYPSSKVLKWVKNVFGRNKSHLLYCSLDTPGRGYALCRALSNLTSSLWPWKST
ncbi:MAG: hypothetical protein NTV15_05700, partial [Candidatus Bathyarchaeota archaeon]|nr:hypothetical protein [Candidatus Bathyarchaeota archaeon]